MKTAISEQEVAEKQNKETKSNSFKGIGFSSPTLELLEEDNASSDFPVQRRKTDNNFSRFVIQRSVVEPLSVAVDEDDDDEEGGGEQLELTKQNFRSYLGLGRFTLEGKSIKAIQNQIEGFEKEKDGSTEDEQIKATGRLENIDQLITTYVEEHQHKLDTNQRRGKAKFVSKDKEQRTIQAVDSFYQEVFIPNKEEYLNDFSLGELNYGDNYSSLTVETFDSLFDKNSKGETFERIRIIVLVYGDFRNKINGEVDEDGNWVSEEDEVYFRKAYKLLDRLKQGIATYNIRHDDDKSSVGLFNGKSSTLDRTNNMSILDKLVDLEYGYLDAFYQYEESSEERDNSGHPTSKFFQAKLEVPSDTIWGKLNGILNKYAPVPGGYNNLEIQLNIPVPAVPGLIVGGKFEMSFERDDNGNLMTLNTKLGVSCGYHVPFLTIKGLLGGYVETKADSVDKLTKLFSYGFYQRMRQSEIVGEGLVNALFGGNSNRVGFNRSEEWAAKIEDEVFKDEDLEEDKEELKRSKKELRDFKSEVELIKFARQFVEELNSEIESLDEDSEYDEDEVISDTFENFRSSIDGLIFHGEVYTADDAHERFLQYTDEIDDGMEESERELNNSIIELAEDIKFRTYYIKNREASLDDSYVETGGFAEIEGEVGAGLANIGWDLTVSTGRKIDKETLEATKGVGVKRQKYKKDRTATIGKGQNNISLEGQAEFGIFTFDVGLDIGSSTKADREGSKDWTIDLDLAATFKTPFAGLGGIVGKAFIALAEIAARKYGEAYNRVDPKTKKSVGFPSPYAMNAILQYNTNDTHTFKEAFENFNAGQFNTDFPMFRSHNVKPSGGVAGKMEDGVLNPEITDHQPGDDYTTGVADDPGEFSVDNGGRGGDTEGFEGKIGVKIDAEIGLKPDRIVDIGFFLLETSEFVVDAHTGTKASVFKFALERGKKLAAIKTKVGGGLQFIPMFVEAFGGGVRPDKDYGFQKLNEEG